ncbi:hypothetical protein D9757_002999 [Collybiopsis confluens]|uniref:Uncharacterized protein n=1 Tax=Collybiopsis confluens TaxID=2823264 RepID=A0A8H5HX19_9AGAR|nr:hypothetical protein D9757_002999 [Collybiopsis confluens]
MQFLNMFGEDDSESPRVPSPWDNISTPSHATPSPSPSPLGTPASGTPASVSSTLHLPLTPGTPAPLLPRLPPESDSGNIEYKLQLLHPTTSRFTRLVTQLKWRLLEGGGQAFYELGVADSGLLVGLSRKDLEETLDTLEMMAGEIGASVIVVKEIEVERSLAEQAKREEDYRERRGRGKGRYLETGYSDSTTTDATDSDTVGIDGVFAMDDPADSDDNLQLQANSQTPSVVDLGVEISSVYKPRPMTLRMQMSNPSATVNLNGHTNGNTKAQSGGNKTRKKLKPPQHASTDTYHTKDSYSNDTSFGRTHSRRQNRDRRRAEKRKALETLVESLPSASSSADLARDDHGGDKAEETANKLLTRLESLHVSRISAIPKEVDSSKVIEEHSENELVNSVATLRADDSSLAPPPHFTVTPMSDDSQEDPLEDDDVFPSPVSSSHHARFPQLSLGLALGETPLDRASTAHSKSHSDINVDRAGQFESVADCMRNVGDGKVDTEDDGPRLIVEALVVRKLSLQEAFLDFGGFGLELS